MGQQIPGNIVRGRRLAPRARLTLLALLVAAPCAAADGTSPDRGPIVPDGGELCGTTPRGALEALARHRAWQAETTFLLPTTQSFDRGGIAVLEDDGTLLRPVGAKVEVDEVAAARAFYRTHGDDYDFLCIYAASDLPFQVLGGRAFAFEENVVQDVAGIGLGLWDYSLDFGSGGRLRSLLVLNGLAAYPADPFQDFIVSNHTLDVLAHEAGHRWSAFVQVDSAGQAGFGLLGAGLAHWNFYFDDDASMLGGNDWADNGDGSWTTVGATLRYGPLEMYLMGLATPEEVGALPVLEDPFGCTPPANYTRAHHPLVGVTCGGRSYAFTVADVIAANGPRVPDAAASPKHHRFAFVLVVGNGHEPSAADLAKLDDIRTLWPAYFSLITDGRASAGVDLDSRAGSVVIEHTALKDTEDTASPIPVTARVAIDQGSIPLAVDPASVELQIGRPGGPLAWTPMTEVAPGEFRVELAPAGTEQEFVYRICAASDSAGIDAAWPVVGLASFRVGPDLEPPQVALLSRPPEFTLGVLPYRLHALATDNLGIARVALACGRNGAGRDTLEMTRAGDSDTFFVDLPFEAGPGDRVDVEAWAVDGSAAALAAFAPQCPPPGCAFSWGYGWEEPLDLADGGCVPAAITVGGRDSWHWLRGAGAGGGGAWKCGDPGPLHYVQGLDAGLTTPELPTLGSAELRFRHRYDLEEAAPGSAYDGAVVELSVAGGPWEPIAPSGGYPAAMDAESQTPLPALTPVYSGRSAGWATGEFEEAVFPIGDRGGSDVRFRLRMVSDAYTGAGGWVVDDLRLVMEPPSVNAGATPTACRRFAAPWPNPARELVRFAAELTRPAHVRLEIFDVRGRQVGVVYDGAAPAGRWAALWVPAADGPFFLTRRRGAPPGAGPAPPGVYLARLSVRPAAGPEETLTRRFVVVR